MMYIDKSRIQVLNQKWTAKTGEFMQAMNDAISKPERDAIIDKYHGYWKIFKSQLKEISYNKCWYSETRNP